MLAKTWKKIGLIILINAIEAAKAQMQSVKTQVQIKKN